MVCLSVRKYSTPPRPKFIAAIGVPWQFHFHCDFILQWHDILYYTIPFLHLIRCGIIMKPKASTNEEEEDRLINGRRALCIHLSLHPDNRSHIVSE